MALIATRRSVGAGLLTAFLMLPGCVVQPLRGAAPVAPLPAWVSEPPKDDVSSLWGVGEGADLEYARRAALKDVAAKLRVAISSQLESRVTVINQTVDKYARSRVLEDVQRTEFKNHSLEKSAASAQGVYALVRVDRRAFVTDTAQQLAAAEKEMSAALAGVDSLAPVERFVALQKALPWIEKAISSAQVLSALDPGFDGNRLRRHESILGKAKGAASELNFDLRFASDAQDVAQAMRGFLNETGMRVGKGGAPLILESSATQDTIFDSKSVRLRVSLSVLDGKGRTLTTREYTAQGSSVSSHAIARQAALKNLGEQLRAAGPVAALGFASR